MNNDELRDLLAKAKQVSDKIDAAHTPENEARLRAEVAAMGGKLTKRGKGKSAFTLTLPNGAVSGVTLADVESVVAKVAAARQPVGR